MVGMGVHLVAKVEERKVEVGKVEIGTVAVVDHEEEYMVEDGEADMALGPEGWEEAG